MTVPPTASPVLSGDDRQRLQLVAVICFGAFALELVGGELAGSQAVQADALDFAVTGFAALAVLAPPRATAALAISIALALLTGWIGLATFTHFLVQQPPEATLMAALGLAALAANGAVLYLLRGRRAQGPAGGFWSGALNDSIGAATLLIAAGVTGLLHNSVADLTVAGVMVVLSAHRLVPELRAAWRNRASVAMPGEPR